MKNLTFAVFLALTSLQPPHQQATPPAFAINVSWARSTSYEYRVVAEGSKEFLEMRQEGKKKWARVEDVTCAHSGNFDSDSFDYSAVCK